MPRAKEMSRVKSATRRRSKISPWSGTIRLAVVFTALIAVNVYFFFFRGGTSVGDLRKLSENKELAIKALPPPRPKAPPKGATPAAPDPKARALRPPEPEVEIPDEGRLVVGTVGAADTLSAVLRREGVPTATANEALAALGKVLDARLVRPGQYFTLHFDAEDRLRGVEYRTSPATLYRVDRFAARKGRDGESWRAGKETAPLEVKVAEVGSAVDPSLSPYEAMKRAGESPTLATSFVDLFPWDLNFYTDVQPGDRMKIVVEKQFLGDSFYKYGRVLAAEYAGRAGAYRAFWFDPGGGRPGGFYNERGESIGKSLLRSPLKFVHVSPGFERKRLRPILHTERGHLGVDYGAPVGTPVWATAPGKVSWKGNRGAAGETVVITHPGGMETTYMHLSRYARGLSVGQAVRQKQVIGYVGMTGLATSPHLHFSVRMGGHFVDPLRLRPAREAPLPPTLREPFASAIVPLLDALARVEVHPARREVARAAAASP